MIEDLMWLLMPQPIEDIAKTQLYLDSPLAHITTETAVFKLAKSRFNSVLERFTVQDYFDHVRRNPQLLFNTKMDYMSIDESVSLLIDWFKFQFGEKWIEKLILCYKVRCH